MGTSPDQQGYKQACGLVQGDRRVVAVGDPWERPPCRQEGGWAALLAVLPLLLPVPPGGGSTDSGREMFSKDDTGLAAMLWQDYW